MTWLRRERLFGEDRQSPLRVRRESLDLAALARAVPLPLSLVAPAEPRLRPVRRPGRSAGQVRGVLAQEVVVSTPLDPFLSLKALAAYSHIGVRKLRDYLEDLTHPLPCYRVGGKILVRRSEFDAWMATYRQRGRADVERVVSDVLKGL